MRLAILLTALVLSGCDQAGEFAKTDEGSARAAVRGLMKDPDSVKFSRLSRCPAERAMFTGSANGKNAFGAYAGETSFISVDGFAATWDSPMYDDLIRRCYAGHPSLKDLLANIPPDEVRMGLHPTP